MYRAKTESTVTVMAVNKEKKFNTVKITVPENLNTEAGLKKVRTLYKSDDVVLWNTAKVVEIAEIQYSMTDEQFFRTAEKMEKPNPAYISRSVNSTVLTVEIVHDDQSFTTETITIDGKLPKENPEQAIQAKINDGYLFEIKSAKTVSGLYGIKQSEYFEKATQGERTVIYKA